MAKVVTRFDKSVIPYFLKLKQKQYSVDYDDETDTMYVSFRKPQCADDSVMDGDFIYHYSQKILVGVTILNARTKKAL